MVSEAIFLRGVNDLQDFTGNGFSDSGNVMVGKFLEAIKNEDVLAFWHMLDRKGQGYFMGMWFYALGNTDLNTISLLSEDENFLRDALSGIVGELRNNLGELMDNPTIGNLSYTDDQHAMVPVTAGIGPEGAPRTDYIPLVLELASAVNQGEGRRFDGGEVGMTCWKIDTLKCFRVQKV